MRVVVVILYFLTLHLAAKKKNEAQQAEQVMNGWIFLTDDQAVSGKSSKWIFFCHIGSLPPIKYDPPIGEVIQMCNKSRTLAEPFFLCVCVPASVHVIGRDVVTSLQVNWIIAPFNMCTVDRWQKEKVLAVCTFEDNTQFCL